MKALLCLFLPLLFLGSCLPSCPSGTDAPLMAPAEIFVDTLWRGTVIIDGQVKVFKGATLTIAPGTDILFVRQDRDQDGLGDGTLIVEGALVAVGSRQQPIRFRSAASDPQPGDWLELRVDFARDCRLSFCEIRDSAHTLHAHFTRAVVEDCTIRNNIDGCRLGQGSFVIRRCLIEDNSGKGINFRNSTVEISGNIIRRNATGIFLFETDRSLLLAGNNFHNNGHNLRLGDFFPHDIAVGRNWWGDPDAQEAAATVYDRKSDATLGTVTIEAAPEWLAATGPRDGVALTSAWELATGGFVDASAVTREGVLYLPGWDGAARALSGDGRLLWQRSLGETIDATPAVDTERLYLQTWGREVVALDRTDGGVRWRFSYPASPADDHRQGGLLRLGDSLLVPGWNGTLYALHPASGKLLWSFTARPPLRATPTSDGQRLYLSGGDGTLWALDLNGRLLWERSLDAPLLSSPVLLPAGVAVLSRAGTLVALTPNGQEMWRHSLQQECWYGAPVYDRGALFVATAAGSLWRLDADSGRTVWRRDGFGPFYATPLVADGRVVVGDNAGMLRVFGGDSADLLASFTVGAPMQGTPLLQGGRLIFGARDQRIHALDLLSADEKKKSP